MTIFEEIISILILHWNTTSGYTNVISLRNDNWY